MTMQHGEDGTMFSTTSGGTASIEVGTRLPRLLKNKIRESFERTFRESERLEVHFVGNKCYVKIEETNLECQIVYCRKAQTMEG